MFRFGVDYYPEHWPVDRWEQDARLMAEASINTVRLAEFAWAKLEPRPNDFDFSWLDKALETLHRYGIQAVLGTPTASPPPWVFDLYPDAYRVLPDGRRQTFGNRVNHCQTHPGMRERSRIITRAMAEHYLDHPDVMGWQIDNELSTYCYCPICKKNFQEWLCNRYGSLDKLNEAWGTIFWSHTYTEWAQIPVPLDTGGVPNPGLALDFKRFMSYTNVEFLREQVGILRQICPSHSITHNFMGFNFEHLNYFDLAMPLDFVAWDNYPRLARKLTREVDPAPLALGHDAMRGLKGKPFWVMEEESGSGGWTTVGTTPQPGEMRLWTYQAIAHGADGIVYFRWRTARYGTEQYWHGVLDHHGQPRRRYAELQKTGMELKEIGSQFLGSEVRAQVAMVLSYDTRWAFQIQPHRSDFDYSAFFASYYKALHSRNISVDVVAPDADLHKYRMVLSPALYVLPKKVADNLVLYVQDGGILLTTARSGVKDDANAVVDMPLPGLFANACGVEVDEYDLLPPDVSVQLELKLPGSTDSLGAKAQFWCDVLAPTTAQVIACYKDHNYAGRAAITLNSYGNGKVIYVGTLGDATLHDKLVEWLVSMAGVKPVLNTPAGVEAAERYNSSQRFLFLLNHTSEPKVVMLDKIYQNLIESKPVSGEIEIGSKEVCVLTKPNE